MSGGLSPGDPVWSPAKLYVPTRKIRARAWLYRIFDRLANSEGNAEDYLAGPWCARCHRWWPEGQPGSKGVYCACGVTDPLAARRFEEAHELPRGAIDNPLLLLLPLLLPSARPKWWKALGLEARPDTQEEAKKSYRRALADAHPDRGGSREQMEKVQKAWAHAGKDYK